MNLESIIFTLQNLSTGAYVAFFVLMLVIVVLVIKKTADPEFIKKVLEKKQMKLMLINNIRDELASLNEGISKLMNDREVIGLYNTDHVGNLIESLKDLQMLITIDEILEDKELQAALLEYNKLTAELLNATYKVEEYIYSHKRDYQDLLMVGARNYRSMKTATQNEDDAAVYKNELIEKLNLSKEQMLEVNNVVEHKRDEIYRGLQISQSKNSELFHKLDDYKDKEINSKTFYFRHLSFA